MLCVVGRVVLRCFWVAVLLAGCATTPPMKVALTELGTSSKSEYGVFGTRFMRSINITGMAPEEVVGTVSMDPDKWSIIEQLKRLSLNPADLPDTLTPRFNNAASMVYMRSFCDTESETFKAKCPSNDDIVNVRNTISLQEKLIGKLASAQIETKVLELAASAINQRPNEAEQLLSALKLRLPGNAFVSSADKSDFETKLRAASEALANEIAVIQAALEQNKKSSNKAGILITSWKYKSEFNADVELAGANAGLTKNKDIYGYAIFGNPVIFTLHVGKDIKALTLADEEKPPSEGGNDQTDTVSFEKLIKEQRLYLTFYQVRAMQVSYSESMESLLAGQLKLKINELLDGLKPFLSTVELKALAELEINLNANFAQYSLSANQGLFDASFGYTKASPLDKNFCKGHENCKIDINRFETIYKNTVPIINSRVNLTKLLEKLD